MIMVSLVLPVMLMLVLVYLFGGAIRTGTAYLSYVVPGVLVLCAEYGASLTAVGLGWASRPTGRGARRGRVPGPVAGATCGTGRPGRGWGACCWPNSPGRPPR